MNSVTNYLSSSMHRIMRGIRGGFFINKGGKKVYGLKAHFRKVGNAKHTKIGDHGAVPVGIRRKSKSAKVGMMRMKANSTNFITKSKHRIMHGERGGFFINKGGKKVYGNKASMRKMGSNSPTKIATPVSVPMSIRRA